MPGLRFGTFKNMQLAESVFIYWTSDLYCTHTYYIVPTPTEIKALSPALDPLLPPTYRKVSRVPEELEKALSNSPQCSPAPCP